jgi:hypothetical protein
LGLSSWSVTGSRVGSLVISHPPQIAGSQWEAIIAARLNLR